MGGEGVLNSLTITIGLGLDSVRLGAARDHLRTRFAGSYREFFRTAQSQRPTGVIDDRVFVSFDESECVDLIEVAEPEVLLDAQGEAVNLRLDEFLTWISRHAYILDENSCFIVPSISLAVTYDAMDLERPNIRLRPSIVSVGVRGYFDFIVE